MIGIIDEAALRDDPQIIAEYLEDYGYLRERISTVLGELQDDLEAPDGVNRLYRLIHTLKGNASACFLDYLVSYFHALEDLLDELRNGRVRYTLVVGAVLERLMELSDDASDSLRQGLEPDINALKNARKLLMTLRKAHGA